MSRCLLSDSIFLCFMASLLALSSSAHADVLEVGSGGLRWVAGGPRAVSVAGISVAAGGGVSEAGFPVASGSGALTEVSDAAGPDRWRGRVAQLAARYDISPALLEAVVWQESRWNASAISPAGARGLAQLMPGTARSLGVDADDPHANLEGGARYLRMQLDAFGGDLEKALAAYNAGPGRVLRAGGIPPIAETRAYVASIMARLSAPVRR